LHIVMLSDVYFPRVNGVSTSIHTFRHDLMRAGYKVTLIAPDYGHPTENEADILRVSGWQVPFDPEDRIMHWFGVRGMLNKLRQNKFDVVHIQTPFAAHIFGVRLARELNVPSVETYHTFFEEYFHHYLPFLPKSWTQSAVRKVARLQCSQVDGLISPSHAMLGLLRKYDVATEAEVIPTGLDSDWFRKGEGRRFREKHGIAPARPTLVHIGRIAFEKNIGFLLDMLVHVRQRIPDVLLILCGEGPATAQLKQQVRSMGLADSVMFAGYLSRAGDLQDCYCAGDAFVFASRTETQGLVLLEAMAMGVPVVALAYLGAEEILRPQRGAVIAPDDPAGFAEHVIALMHDPTRRERLSEEARVYAREWGSHVFAEKLVHYYRTIAAAKSRTA